MSGSTVRGGGAFAEQLERENRQMAERLSQLKLTLKKQKESRGKRPHGVIWRSSSKALGNSANILKTTPKGSRSTAAHPPAADGPGAGRRRKGPSRATKPSQPGGKSGDQFVPRPPADPGVAPAETHAQHRRPPAVSPLQELPGPEHGAPPDPEELALLGDDGFDEEASHASFLDALKDWRSGGGAAEQPSSRSETGAGTGHAMNGATAGTGGGGDLLDGPDYDEAAAAASFQAALAEWRTGTPAGGRTGTTGTSKPPAQQAGMWVPPAEPAEVLSAGTDAPARSQSAAPVIAFEKKTTLSYIEKLMLKRRRQNPEEISRAGSTSPQSSSPTERAEATEPASPAQSVDGLGALREAVLGEGYFEPAAGGWVGSAGGDAGGGNGKVILVVEEISADDSDKYNDLPEAYCVVNEPGEEPTGPSAEPLSDHDTESSGTPTPVMVHQDDDASGAELVVTPENDGAVDANMSTANAAVPVVAEPVSDDEGEVGEGTTVAPAHPGDSDGEGPLVRPPVDTAALAATITALAPTAEPASPVPRIEKRKSMLLADQEQARAEVIAAQSPHRKIITPGLMDDFEEMEASSVTGF